MPSFKIFTETLTRREYVVEAEDDEHARDIFYEVGADISEEEIIEENINSIQEITNEK